MIRERIKEKPLVSVIVPVYNAQEYLKQCVDSILAQTYDLLEVILVDDGSTDDSGRICDAYAEADARVEVLHKANGGLISAWKAGVDLSHGEYLAFVDSDDWVDAVMIETLVKHSTFGDDGSVRDDSDAEIICCNPTMEYPDGKKGYEPHGAAPGVYTGERLRGEIFRHILGNEQRLVTMSRCTRLFSRLLITRNMHYSDPSIRMGEDVMITLPAILDCDRLVILKNAEYYHYRYNTASMVHRYDPDLNQVMRLFMEILRKILREKLQGSRLHDMRVSDGEIRALADKEYIFLFMLQIRNELRLGGNNCVERIRTLCLENRLPELTTQNPVTVRGRANRLLYAIEKKPTTARIRLASLLFRMTHR